MMGRKMTPRLQSMQRATSRITGGPGKPAAPGRGNLASSLGAGAAAKRVADMAQALPKKNGGMVKKKAASDKAGRAMKKTSADAKGRAMKKGK
jgi:hypothetical protein